MQYKPRTHFKQEHCEILKNIIVNKKRVCRKDLYSEYPEFKIYTDKSIANKIISIKNEIKSRIVNL